MALPGPRPCTSISVPASAAPRNAADNARAYGPDGERRATPKLWENSFTRLLRERSSDRSLDWGRCHATRGWSSQHGQPIGDGSGAGLRGRGGRIDLEIVSHATMHA